MRELKFRAWNKTANGMLEWYFLRDTPFSELLDKPHLTMMQYTGLKDKSGVEIYEGDIIATERHHEDRKPVNPTVVKYGECGGGGPDEAFRTMGFYTEDQIEDKVFSVEEGLLDHDHDRLVVIGNIYESPEKMHV